MATRTTRDLVYRAMTELGRLYTGDAPNSADYNTVEALIDPLVDQLAAENIVYVDDIDAIDTSCFLPLARLLAIEASRSFGNDAIQSLITNNRAANVDALREREFETLRRVTAPARTRRFLKVDHLL